MSALLAYAESSDPALAVFLRLAATTGARRSQLLGIQWADVDLERHALALTRALVEGPNGPVLTATKTRRAYRVEIDHASAAALRAHMPEQGVSDGFVFAHDDGRPWLPNFVTKRFIANREAAGLPWFRLHDDADVRVMPTQMLAAGVPIVTVSQRLSHARASTTLNVYAHSVPGGDHAAAEGLASLLDG